MFQSNEKSAGTQYTLTVTLLALAFVFSPALLVLSNQFGYLSISLAVASSTLCVALAWLNWSKYSRLTIPSIEVPLQNNPRGNA
ncbi:MAG: hypothetical protein U0R19_40350 [Bryobacteraceae bacterium]